MQQDPPACVHDADYTPTFLSERRLTVCSRRTTRPTEAPVRGGFWSGGELGDWGKGVLRGSSGKRNVEVCHLICHCRRYATVVLQVA